MSSTPSVLQRIEKCIGLSLAGDNQSALEEIESIIQECSDGTPDDQAYAHFAKGNTLIRLGRHKDALTSLRTAATLDHNNPSILFNLGMEEMCAGNTRRAKEYLQRAAQLGHEKAPRAVEALESGSAIAMPLGENEEFPDIIRGHLERGIANVKEGRLDDAIVEYKRAIELAPEFGHTYTLLGVAYEQLHEFEKALENHTRAVELDEGNAVAYYNRGVIHGLLGEASAALADYSRSIELDPRDADAWHNRGMLHKKAERYQDAISDFTHAIAVNPGYAMAYNDRGIAHSRLNQPDEALRDHTRALELDPGQSLFHINLGGCCINRGEVERGVAHLLQAVLLGDKRGEELLKELTGEDIDFDSFRRTK